MVADEQPRGSRLKRAAAGHRETRLERAARISDAYGLVLVLILITFVVTMTLPQEGGAGRLFAVVVGALTAIIALTSSDVRPGRVRGALILALASVLAALLGALIPSNALLGIAFTINAILLLIAAGT